MKERPFGISSVAERMTIISASGQNPLITKLEHGVSLTDTDKHFLSAMTAQSRLVGSRCDLIGEGERPEKAFLITQGFACRYKILPGGNRQILALLLPGDLCDLNFTLLDAMDHSIGTLSPCSVVDISRTTALELNQNYPRILQALIHAALVDNSVSREWLVNLGQRQADQRVAHLFCELLLRLQFVGCVTRNAFYFPIRQADLGEVLGTSTVHVNRVLQDLRRRQLIILQDRQLEIPDIEALMAFCSFNPSYLHRTRIAS